MAWNNIWNPSTLNWRLNERHVSFEKQPVAISVYKGFDGLLLICEWKYDSGAELQVRKEIDAGQGEENKGMEEPAFPWRTFPSSSPVMSMA